MFATNLCRLSANKFSFPFRSFKKINNCLPNPTLAKSGNEAVKCWHAVMLSGIIVHQMYLHHNIGETMPPKHLHIWNLFPQRLWENVGLWSDFIPMHVVTFLHRPVNMNPQIPQPTHSASAGQILAQISRQNVAPQQVNQSSTTSPLHAGPAGGWPGAGPAARPQFNNQVN